MLGLALVMLVALVLPIPRATAIHEAGCPHPAPSAGAPAWPPSPQDGEFDIAHFGEGHWNEGQGPETMPVLVQELVSYEPAYVAFSSDMAANGVRPQLECFRDLMAPVAAAGVPWFDSPGNHDRQSHAPVAGIDVLGGIETWRDVFAEMPQPWGNGPHPGPGFVVPDAEPDAGPGARTHYFFDYGPPGEAPAVRLIVLDNSMHSITRSDLDQHPSLPNELDASQFAFLRRAASDAADQGLLTFVMMHIPTQDPRDPTNAVAFSLNHTMGKFDGMHTDNRVFDALATATGVDAVLLGHIVGNIVYQVGDVSYFVDGGGGGTPYAFREVGTDTGYYYGYRIMRLFKTGEEQWAFRSYLVPLADSLEVEAPEGPVALGSTVTLRAAAVQPFDPELPVRSVGVQWSTDEPFRVELRPTDHDRVDHATVPQLAYMWSTSNPAVLAPVPGPDDPVDDPAFDPETMTTSGQFRAAGKGAARITIATGTHAETVIVRSR